MSELSDDRGPVGLAEVVMIDLVLTATTPR